MSAITEALAALAARGGPVMMIIAALSVATLALILWKLWHFLRLGLWRVRRAEVALAEAAGAGLAAGAAVAGGARGLRGRLAAAAFAARLSRPDAAAREETLRIARSLLAEARVGLRPLDVIATVAPLLGLLGTVLGMIGAFQALQDSGVRADPAVLAGGIWEALLTTAAGMAVAIPASLAHSWGEAALERLRHDLEDLATRIFLLPGGKGGA